MPVKIGLIPQRLLLQRHHLHGLLPSVEQRPKGLKRTDTYTVAAKESNDEIDLSLHTERVPIADAEQTETPLPILCEGYVTKQGGRIKTWKKRWCRLNSEELSYFKPNEDNPKAPPHQNLQGRIPISAIVSIEKVFGDKAKRRFMFRLVTAARVWMMTTDTEHEVDRWIKAIQFAKSTNGGTKDWSALSDSDLAEMQAGADTACATEIAERLRGLRLEALEILEEIMHRDIAQDTHSSPLYPSILSITLTGDSKVCLSQRTLSEPPDHFASLNETVLLRPSTTVSAFSVVYFKDDHYLLRPFYVLYVYDTYPSDAFVYIPQIDCPCYKYEVIVRV
ncbi:hypothetical protein PROFUN_02492 [Planoprotostelium fungivorum]|uniref:PH domain-containing protein n=1 Tax=Planoprotostelium fungivorum TaxID=1890364 RepID=A0A2P6MP48_9EUKA|nr:hypothetical protein PROFUN_02492 [Planoprotostelium fungivorum]